MHAQCGAGTTSPVQVHHSVPDQTAAMALSSALRVAARAACAAGRSFLRMAKSSSSACAAHALDQLASYNCCNGPRTLSETTGVA